MISVIDCRNDYLENSKVWVHVTHDQLVIGSLSIEECGEFAWINDLFVTPEWRGKGIATAMVSHAVKIAATIVGSPRGVSAGINRHNVPSVHLFEKLGFEWVYSYPESETRLYTRLLSETSLTKESQ